MQRYIAIAALGIACGQPAGNPTGLYETWSEHGIALRIPTAALVTAEPDAVTVDARDGSRWFEIRWVPLPDGSVEDAGTLWLQRNCLTLVRDDGWSTADAWAGGGRCRYREWDYRAIVLVERHGDRGLLTAYLAHEDQMNFENAWVDFNATALSATGGSSPRKSPDPTEVREALRAGIRALPPTTKPQLEGGRLTDTAFSSARERLASRTLSSLPEQLAPPRPASTP